jgi:hypothetical protein
MRKTLIGNQVVTYDLTTSQWFREDQKVVIGTVGLAYKMIIVQFIVVNIQLYFNSKFLDLDMKYFVLHQLYSVIFFVILAYISSSFFYDKK